MIVGFDKIRRPSYEGLELTHTTVSRQEETSETKQWPTYDFMMTILQT